MTDVGIFSEAFSEGANKRQAKTRAHFRGGVCSRRERSSHSPQPEDGSHIDWLWQAGALTLLTAGQASAVPALVRRLSEPRPVPSCHS